MGIFRRVLTPPSERATVQTIDIRDPEIWRNVAWPDKMDTATGITVSPESSMRNTAVYNAVTIIAGTVGSLPLPVYQRLDNEGRERATDHPLYPLLHDEPNSMMTSMTYWEMALVHLLHHGNFYAEKEWGPLNELRALWPLPANRVEPKLLVEDDLKSGLYYEITKKNGQTYSMMSKDIFHVPGLGFDGIKGYSVIKMAKEAVGLGLAAEAFGERFYKNNMRPGIVLKLSGKFEDLSDQALKNLKQSFQEQHGGAENAHKPLFLEEGMDFASYSIAPEDAQFLELRKFQVVEVARMFNLPPHKLGDLDRATFSNIEQQELNFVIGTIRPWLVRIEQLIKARLFSIADQGTYYAEFLVDALLRGDSAARAAFYHSMRMDGLMNADEIRARENLNPIPGGDKYYMPVNMMPTDAPPTTPALMAAASVRSHSSRSGVARRQVRDSYKRVFREGTQRVVRGERRNVMKILKQHKDPDELKAHLEEFYRGAQQEFIVKQMAGPFFSLAEAIQPLAADQVGLERDMTSEVQAAVKIHVDKFAYREAMQSYNRLVKIVGSPLRAKKPEPDLEELFGDEFDGMEESRPDRVAEWETVRTDGMVSRTVFEASGIIALVWAANENSCDYCAEMNGRTVGIDIPFIGPDDSLSVEGADDMSPSWNCTSPPLHDGCLCSIEPG